MSDELPSNQDLEKYLHELPKAIIKRLPENTDKRECERLADIVYGLAQQSREKPADRS